MTLQRKLAVRYGAIVAVCCVLLAGLAYHEFVTEPNERKALGIPEPPESFWSEYFEVLVYAMVPVILGGGWWVMRKTLRPLDALARDLEKVSAANLREPLPRTYSGDEVDRLTNSFNALTIRLNESFQQMRQFTLHASHELKTPLTVMWLQLGTLLQEEQSLSIAQRESLECQLNEVQRLGRIVDALTFLTKADSGQVTLQRLPVSLSDLVREAYDDAQILAEPHDVKVTLSECAEVRLLGDRDRLRQLLLNLVDNAIKYNRPGGLVTIALRRTDQAVELEIANTGDGIGADLQPRLFERFVRGDEARSRAIEGSGLGLSICQWIVQAHGGTIALSSEPGRMTTTQVHWGVNAAPGESTPDKLTCATSVRRHTEQSCARL